MKYEVDYDEYDYDKEEQPKTKKYPKDSECGEVRIKADNVYITINCKEKKKEC